MSFEEKGTWAYAVISAVLAVIYFATILGQLSTTAAADIDYQQSLLAVVAATIALTILGMIGIGILAPADANRSDQRDRDINRLGDYAGGTVLAIAMIVPFGLALAEAQHFWIANAMYLAFVLGGLCSAGVKLVLYRRGF